MDPNLKTIIRAAVDSVEKGRIKTKTQAVVAATNTAVDYLEKVYGDYSYGIPPKMKQELDEFTPALRTALQIKEDLDERIR